jgi:hypothetical protein
MRFVTPRSPHPRWVHNVMNAVINKYWLHPRLPSASLVFNIFLRELHLQAEQNGLAVPKVNVSFLRRKLRRLDPKVTRYRHSLAAVRQQLSSAQPAIRSQR